MDVSFWFGGIALERRGTRIALVGRMCGPEPSDSRTPLIPGWPCMEEMRPCGSHCDERIDHGAACGYLPEEAKNDRPATGLRSGRLHNSAVDVQPGPTVRGPLDIGEQSAPLPALFAQPGQLVDRKDVVETGHPPRGTAAMSVPEAVTSRVAAELRSVAVVIEDVVEVSTPTLALLEVSRTIHTALVLLRDSEGR